MSETLEKLKSEVEAAQRALAEAEERFALQEGTYRSVAKKTENTGKRLQTDKAQHESEIQYRRLFENAQDGILILDAQSGKILDANPFILDLLSYRLDELKGKMLWEIGLFKDIEASKAAFEALQSDGYIRYEDLPLETKEGQQIDVEFVSNIYDIGDRKVIQCNIRDITETLLAKKLLTASHDLLQNVLENIPVRVFWKDTELRYLGCNTAFAHDAGLSYPEELIGKDDFEMPWREQAELYRADDKKVIKSGIPELGYEEPQNTPDGRTIWLRTSKVPMRAADGKVFAMLGIYEDITERKHAEELQRKSETEFRALVESTSDWIWKVSQNGIYTYVSPQIESLLGYQPQEVVGKSPFDFMPEGEAKRVGDAFKTILDKHAPIHSLENVNISKDGSLKVLETNGVPFFDDKGEFLGYIGMDRDITKRKKMEEALKESEEKYRSLFENAQIGIFMTRTSDGKLVLANDAMARMFGYDSSDEAVADYIGSEHYVEPEKRKKLIETLQKHGRFDNIEVHLTRKDGVARWFLYSGRLVQDNHFIEGIAVDITERKQSEKKLLLFHTLIDHSSDAIEVIEPEMLQLLDVNETSCRTLGYSREELLTMSIYDIDPEFTPERAKATEEQLQKEGNVSFEGLHQRKDGSTFPVEVSTTLVELDRPYLISISRDITKRKQDEATIKHTNRALSLLSQCNTLLVHATNEQEILSGICNLTVETGGYLMAWVGFTEHDAKKSVRPVAQSGYGENYLDNLNITWADTKLGRGPTGTAIRTGRTVINQNILTNPDMAPWREAAIRHGYQSSIALPLVSNKQVLGALNIYAAEPNAFSKEKEVPLLKELAGDLAYGILTLRSRKAIEKHSAILQQSLEQSIQTIAATVEARDPYTAGHQRRVGELSRAIARELGLPEEQINGIYLAAIIHDLGKIHIPAEILSKPGKLSDLEYKLVQEHPQAGHDILKDVQFPWPIAEIILQHHERVDGTGYPQGLKGDAILLEAKIIAVADTVEAMSSHRPYRPGVEVAFALEEIKKERGTHFDPAVVDACITLFEARDYQLPD